MLISRLTTAATVLALSAAPTFAADSKENLQFILMGFQLTPYECASIVGSPVTRQEEMAFDVTCAANANGSGAQTLYFYQILNGQIIIKPQ